MSRLSCLSLVTVALLLGLGAARAVEAADTELPVGARGFAGMIKGEVISAGEGELVMRVAEVTKVWKHSKAENPQSLVGQRVLIRAAGKDTPPARFIATLKAGEVVDVDVNNREGSVLTLVELTKAQREKTGAGK